MYFIKYKKIIIKASLYKNSSIGEEGINRVNWLHDCLQKKWNL
jgi:hypothetical protein